MANGIFHVEGRAVEFFDGSDWVGCDGSTCPGPVRMQISSRIRDVSTCDGFECINGVRYRWYPSTCASVTSTWPPIRKFVLPALAGVALGLAMGLALVIAIDWRAGGSVDPRCALGWRGYVEFHVVAENSDRVTCAYRPEVGEPSTTNS